MCLNKIKIVLILFFITTLFYAQDPIFYNTNSSLLFLNPSYAGSNGGFRLQNNYRNQWPNLSGNYITYGTSADCYLKKIKGGIGLSILHDDQARGTLKNTNYNFIYAQHLKINDKLLIIPSVEFSYINYFLDKNKLSFGSQINPRSGVVWVNTTNNPVLVKTNYDISGGFLLQYNNLFSFGFTTHHINQPDIGLVGYSKLPIRFTIHASAFLNSKNNNLKYQSILRYFQQQNFQMLQLNNQFILHKNYAFGVFINSSGSGGLNLGYINKWFSVNFLYDLTYSKLSGNTAGSHELAFTFNILPKEKRISGLYTLENF